LFVKRVFIRNFRSLEKINISFNPGLSILVGKNNAGKSNIIRALDYVLGETYPTFRNIEYKDFYRESMNEEPRESFLIMAWLGGNDIDINLLSQINRRVYINQLPQKPDWNNPNYFLENFHQGQGNWKTYGELGYQLSKAEHIILFLAVPREGKRNDRVFGIVFKENKKWFCVTSPAESLRDALLTTAYIPSFRDPNSQLRINQYTWYGKLIRYLYDQRTTEQTDKIKSAQNAQIEILGEIFKNITERLQNTLRKAVFHYGVSFVPGANTRDDEHKYITLFVDDGLNTPFYEKGSGIQSALIIALFSLYCTQFHDASSLMLIEEPELYLHPQAKRSIEAQLVGFIEQGKAEHGNEFAHQVIVSTHSPEFLRSVPLNQAAVIRRPHNQINTVAIQSKKSLPRVQQALQTKNIELLFADYAILVEGGEEYIIPPLADLVFGQRNWLDFHNITVVRVNGKGGFITYVQILEDFRIPWTILTDLDFITDEIIKFQEYLVDIKEELEDIRNKLNQLFNKPKGQEIKEKLFSPQVRDWQNLYQMVRNAIDDIAYNQNLSQDRREEIKSLWDSLADRVSKPNYKEFFNEPSNTDQLERVLTKLHDKNIFVLSKGELEDYITSQGMALGSSKDLRALEIGGKLLECASLEDADQWLTTDEFITMLQSISNQIQKS